ncbi:MAG: hypothetical protein ICV78_19935, partial [Tolypothrix sp. Co-bin9]|nr:hypothetical protein [Tolypothrix sp. Co-bin9]
VKITDLDHKYAFSCQQRLLELQNNVNAELEKASKALGKATHSEDESLFDDLFNDFWDEITNSLTQLLNRVIESRHSQDDYLKKQVEDVFQICRQDTGIPTIEEIERSANSVGAYSTAYSNYLHTIRTYLSKRFLCLDDGLKDSIEEIKYLVTEVLVKQGHLGGLTKARGSEFLKVIAEQVPDNLSTLKQGFQIISDFQLSYRGLIQHRIRKHLDGLTPNSTVRLPQHPSAQHILETLEELYPEAIYKCENALQNLLSEPSQAAFAMVEEFVDRVLRAEKVDREWRKFLREVRTQVWAEEFKPLAENTRLRDEWFNLVERTKAMSEPPLMQFLN